MAHLHGKKGKAMIHIGAVDAPVTIGEIDAAVNECLKTEADRTACPRLGVGDGASKSRGPGGKERKA